MGLLGFWKGFGKTLQKNWVVSFAYHLLEEYGDLVATRDGKLDRTHLLELVQPPLLSKHLVTYHHLKELRLSF